LKEEEEQRGRNGQVDLVVVEEHDGPVKLVEWVRFDLVDLVAPVLIVLEG
jgi:hypothetical protein